MSLRDLPRPEDRRADETHEDFCERMWADEAAAIRDRLPERHMRCWKRGCRTPARWVAVRGEDFPNPARAAASCGTHRHQLTRRGWHAFELKRLEARPAEFLQYFTDNVAQPIRAVLLWLREERVL